MKTKLLLLITQAEMGGAQKYVYLLATHLARRAYDVTVASGGEGWLTRSLEAAGVRVVVLPDLVREIDLRRDGRALAQIRRLISRDKFDIVHCNSSKAGILGRMAARLAGAPVVVFTAHGFVFNEPMSPARRLVYTWLERLGVWLSDSVIAVSEADRESALSTRVASGERITVIHNGIDSDLMPPVAGPTIREELGLEPSAPLIVNIANLYPTKGHSYLVRAFGQVVKEHPGAHCAIIGDGSLRPDLESQIRGSELSSSVHLMAARDEAGRCLAKEPALFVLSSIKEGCPFALLEAMSAACPIIATRVGGIPELIDHEETGLLVPAADPDAMARAISDLLNDPQRARKLGAAARERAHNTFSLDRMIDQTEELYRRLLSGKRRGADVGVEALFPLGGR